MRSELTAHPPSEECDSCGEHVPVRVIDNDGYAPNELICEGCFSSEEAYWDCLPLPKFPKEEV